MSKSSPEPPDYWQIFQALPESYLLFEADDPTYTIVELNAARERLTGVSRKDAIGKPLFEVYPDTSDEFARTGVNKVRRQLQKVLRTGKPTKVDMLRYDMATEEGGIAVRYWQSQYLPLKNSAGKLTYIVAITRDVTDAQAAESRVATAEERLEAALSIGKVRSWVWEVSGDKVIADTNLSQMFGVPASKPTGLSLQTFLDTIHPSDRKRIATEIRRAVRQRATFEQEYRTFDSKGSIHWVLARGKVEEHDGKLVFPGVIVDITERRDLQAQVELARKQDVLNRQAAKLLQERNDELEAIGRTKDEFVALASHQLRTPATAVKQYLGMVLQGYVGDVSPLQMEMLEKAFESNERQIQIINQILNAARVDTGKLVMTNAPIDICALVQGIADEMRPAIERRHHVFKVSVPKRAIPIVADMGYLRMAIENLVNNASIYTPEGGTVTIRLEAVGKQVRLSITDTGVGIRKADLGKLFAKFSRIHNPLSVAAGGSGIGLFLAAEIVRLHGGSITVESKLHKGTTFAISLPKAHNTT